MNEGLCDPRGRATAAIIALWVWLVADIANTLSGLYAIWALEGFGALSAAPDYDRVDRIEMIGSILFLIAMAGSVILVSRWIMRVNHNAQQWSDGVSITPGWNVGWFFVPIASLFKPFQGVRQTWQASIAPDDPESVDVPIFMRAWWGCFLAMSFIGNLSFRLSMRAETANELITVRWINTVTLLVDIPAALLLVMLIRRLSAIQHDAITTGTFIESAG